MAEVAFIVTILALLVLAMMELVGTGDLWPEEGVGRGTTVDRYREVAAAVGDTPKETISLCVNKLIGDCCTVGLVRSTKDVDVGCI